MIFPLISYSHLLELIFKLLDSLKNFAIFLIFSTLLVYAVDKFTYSHPFILSDNRHYTFYIWKRLFLKYPFFKFSMIPIYIIFGFYFINQASKNGFINRYSGLNKNLNFFQIFAFFIFTCLALIPSPLLEFRYFIIPFYFLLISILKPCHSKLRLTIQLSFFISINLLTLYNFILLPFPWPSEIEPIARFIY